MSHPPETPGAPTGGPEQQYLEFLAQGRFMIQRSVQTGAYVFYPRVAEPRTGAPLEWVAACGLGTVYATSVMRQRPPAPHYNLALIDLDEGVRMMSRIEGIAPESVRIGLRVRARIITEAAGPLVVFDPLDSVDSVDSVGTASRAAHSGALA
jgi:uncharacterized OB-fold protein